MIPFVVVEWLDAWADNEEFVKTGKVDENHKAAVIRTAGWLLVDNETGLSLFNEQAPAEDCWRGRTFIPRGMIVSVEPYKLTKRRTKDKAQATAPPEER
ncbi:MAG: hypothetical protein LC723_06885 [Actinobacteria bacterium]|nr:hypothetical protein [Actinomycetota bacterium]